jgi:hypothetical protein
VGSESKEGRVHHEGVGVAYEEVWGDGGSLVGWRLGVPVLRGCSGGSRGRQGCEGHGLELGACGVGSGGLSA